MFSFRLVPGLLAVVLDTVHQFNETWIPVHVGPVWIRFKPLVVLVAETDRRLQPSQRFHLAALQQVSRRKPVGDIVVGFGDLPDFRRQLLVCLGVLSLGTEGDGKDRSYAVDLRMSLQHLLKDLDGLVNLTFVVKNARPE